MKHWIQALRLPLMVVGIALIFYGERYLDGQAAHWWLVGAGAVALIVATGIAYLSKLRTEFAGERKSWHVVIAWQTLVVMGIAVYFGYRKLLGTAATPETHLTKAALAVWTTAVIIGLIWGLGVEWAFRSNGRGALAEPKRVLRSGHSWLLVGLLLGTITCLNYAAVKKDKSWDWSYLRTSKPSESTTALLSSLDKEVSVGVFFSPTNEVLSQVKTYVDNLSRQNSKVKIEYFDADINPGAAESYKASKNGQIIIKYESANERMDLGTTLSGARKTLRNMDAEFQKALLAATEKRKILYFTRGHGELDWTGSGTDTMRTIKLLESYLRGQNFTLRFFGIGEGSTKQVPDDADAVVIIGGNTSMLSEEVAALNDYANRGGSVFAMLDLDPPSDDTVSKNSRDVEHDPLVKWLADHGAKYIPVPLANEGNYVAASRSEADKWFLFTNSFTTHESITSLARNDQRAALLTFRSGYLQVTPDTKDWQAFETVRSLADSFPDENRDFKFNEGKEKKSAVVMGAAIVRKEAPGVSKRGKLLVLSDASAVGDVLVRNQGNLTYFVEGLRWLVGDSKKTGGIASTEEDVRIRHTRKEDLAWFYSTVLLVPALIIAIGAIANRRARRTR